MQVELLSDKYKVHILTNKNVDEIYDLLSKNILYYEYCPPFVTPADDPGGYENIAAWQGNRR